MTEEQIQPGRELDALIAEQIMEIDVFYCPEEKDWFVIDNRSNHTDERILEYSTDITAAWDVIEHLKQMPAFNEIDLTVRSDGVTTEIWYGCEARSIETETVPYGICLAALDALQDQQ
jgi:hypothetical protein